MAKSSEAKGRAKRAAGELTDNDQLKREGSIDKTTGKAKDAIEQFANKAKSLTKDDS